MGSGSGNTVSTAEINVISEGVKPREETPMQTMPHTPAKPAPTPTMPHTPAKPAPVPAKPCGITGTPATPTPGGKIYYASPGDDLGQAVSALKPGDTLYLRGGTYDKEFSGGEIPSGTSWSSPVTIAAAPGEQVILRPSGGNRVFTFSDQQYIVIDGLVMDAANTSYDVLKIDEGGAGNIRIQNSELMNAPSQGILAFGSGNEFINLDVHDNGSQCFGPAHCHGIYLESDHNLIQGSRFHDQPKGLGIHLYNGYDGTSVHDNLVTGNTSYGNSGGGGVVTSGANNIFSNNNVYDNGNLGLKVDYGAENTQVVNNTFNSNGQCLEIGDGASNTTDAGNSCNGGGGGGASGGAGAGSAGAGGGSGLPAAGCSAAPPASKSSGTPASSSPSKPTASSGQACFTLGGKNVAAKDFDMARQWAQEGVRVTGYSDLASRKVGEFDSVPPVGGVARGVGVGGGAGEEIDMGEAVVLDFKTPQTQLNVGLRDLYVEGDIVEDGTETASWAAYKDGKVVAQGTADGTTELNQKNNGTGLAEFKVDVPGGMDQLIFYSAERGSDFHVEFVEATNPNGCGSSSGGGSAAGSSGGSRSSGGGSSGSGSRSGICDVIADCVAPPSGCRYVRTESPGTCPITCGSLVCDGNELPVDPAGPRAGSGSSAGGPDSGSGSGSSGGGSSGSSTRPSSGDGPSLPRTNGSTFYVSPSGSDSVSCAEAQNTGTPMRTIKAAVRCLQAGDTLYIRGGTYDEEFTGGEIPSGTSWSNPVIIAAYPGESVTLRPSSGDRVFTFVQPQQYIILDGLIMDASNVRYDAVKITCTGDCSQNANHIRIQNSEIKNAANQGILGGVESEFINLDVHDNGRECGMGNGMYCHGIYIASGNNLIEGSRFYNNSGCGIHLYNGSEDGAVHDNIVSNNQSFGNGTCGIVITSGSGNKVYGNTVYNNDSGIDLKPTVCPSFDPCCIT